MLADLHIENGTVSERVKTLLESHSGMARELDDVNKELSQARCFTVCATSTKVGMLIKELNESKAELEKISEMLTGKVLKTGGFTGSVSDGVKYIMGLLDEIEKDLSQSHKAFGKHWDGHLVSSVENAVKKIEQKGGWIIPKVGDLVTRIGDTEIGRIKAMAGGTILVRWESGVDTSLSILGTKPA